MGNIKTRKTAKEMFVKLQSTYIKTGLVTRLDLKLELSSNRFVKEQLTYFFELFFCKFQELQKTGAQMEEEEIFSQLFIAIPKSY